MTTALVGLHPGLKNNYRDGQPPGEVRDGNRLADNFGAGAIRHVETLDAQIHRGDWRFECHSPVQVSDPERLTSVLAKYGIGFRSPPKQVHQALLTTIMPAVRRLDRLELERILFGGGKRWEEECQARRWIRDVRNKIVNEGLNNVNDVYLGAGTQITSWYVGLVKTTNTYAAADTLASHSGWTESTDYSGSRKAWTVNGASSSQSVSNSSSPASFAINASITVLGGFLSSASSGTSGKLYSAADLASSRAVVSGDTLLVTATFTQASST